VASNRAVSLQVTVSHMRVVPSRRRRDAEFPWAERPFPDQPKVSADVAGSLLDNSCSVKTECSAPIQVNATRPPADLSRRRLYVPTGLAVGVGIMTCVVHEATRCWWERL